MMGSIYSRFESRIVENSLKKKTTLIFNQVTKRRDSCFLLYVTLYSLCLTERFLLKSIIGKVAVSDFDKF